MYSADCYIINVALVRTTISISAKYQSNKKDFFFQEKFPEHVLFSAVDDDALGVFLGPKTINCCISVT